MINAEGRLKPIRLPAPKCKLCEDTGFIIVFAADGFTSASKPCSCMPAKVTQSHFDNSRIPAAFQNARLAGLPAKTEDWRRAIQKARSYIAGFPAANDPTGIVIGSTIGGGKTRLACAIAHELLSRKFEVLFVDYPVLLELTRREFNKAKDRSAEEDLYIPDLEEVTRAPVLVIDDLGGVRNSEWVEDVSASLLNDRYNNQRATIATTSFWHDRFARGNDQMPLQTRRLEDRIGERACSKLFEMCTPIWIGEIA